MAVIGRRLDDKAQLGLDFIVGFSIFILGFIFVSMMMSGLLVHLQSKTIDYDAVAYRTSVILVEDPGEPTDWQFLNLQFPENRDSLLRIGLALEKSTPGILNERKLERFFLQSSSPSCSGQDIFCYPGDYRNKVIFGDYPYNFNISLKYLSGSEKVYSVGPVFPEKHGYVKRAIKVRESSILSIPTNTSGTSNVTTVHIDFPLLYQRSVEYRVDPLNDELRINFTNFSEDRTLELLTVCYPACTVPFPDSPTIRFYVNDIEDYLSSPDKVKINANQNLSILIETGYFNRIGLDDFSKVNITSYFSANATDLPTYDYAYSSPNLAIIPPSPAVMEVRIW